MFFAVFASSAKDAKPLTGWKKPRQEAMSAFRRSSHRNDGQRVLRGQNFIQPDGVK